MGSPQAPSTFLSPTLLPELIFFWSVNWQGSIQVYSLMCQTVYSLEHFPEFLETWQSVEGWLDSITDIES